MAKHDHPLRKYRKERGLDCDELGKQLGLAGSTVRSYENGNREIDPEMAVHIEKKIGIPRRELNELWASA